MKLIEDFSFSVFVWQWFLLIALGLWLFCLIDILRHNFDSNNKLIWLIVILFVPLMGAILYLILGRKQRLKTN